MPRFNFLNVMALLICAIILFGCNQGKVEIHHAFPQQFRDVFMKAGIDVDDFGMEMSKDAHRGANSLHNQGGSSVWNKQWVEFFKKNPNPTKAQCVNQLKSILSKTGYAGTVSFVNYKTKQATGNVIAVTKDQWVLIATGIGTWLINLLGGFSFGVVILSFFAAIGTTVLGFFGVITGHPAAVGIGFVVCVVGLLALFGIGWIIIF